MWNPTQYEKFKAQRTKPFDDLVALLADAPIRNAIDLGCGTGELTLKLFERTKPARLVGLDSSPAMLEKSRAFARNGLEFRLGNIADALDGTYDLVFSNAALHWLPDHDTLFARLLSHVSPEGQIAVQMPHNFDHPSHRIARSVAEKIAPEIFAGRPALSGTLALERYAEIFFAQGFTDQVCRVEVYGHAMASGADVVEWTRGSLLTAYQELLTPDAFTRFLDAYRAELLKTIGTGPYFYAFKRILLWGRRG